VHNLARLYKATAGGPAMFAPVLVAEEVLDRLQREAMDDESVQPLMRTVNRIHVIEESRHVRYARSELQRLMPTLSRRQLAGQRLVTAVVCKLLVDSLIDPRVYAAVGIDPARGRALAKANPHYQESMRWMAGRIMPFLQQTGIVGGPSERLYRGVYLL
jgi:hypothetical protein